MSFRSQAQNLVPNPSFEEHDSCPDGLSQITKAKNWLSILGTPDYFHKCTSTPNLYGIPHNIFGFQDVFSSGDSAYVGLGLYLDIDPEYREVMGVKLSEKLILNEKYLFSMKISPSRQNCCPCIVNKIGIKLKCDLFSNSLSRSDLIDNNSNLYSENQFSDSSTWQTFSGEFYADSSYQYLLIGVFFTNSEVNYGCSTIVNKTSYYFIDDLILVNKSSLNNIQINTTSLDGNFHLKALDSTFENCLFEVYNSLGQIIYKNTMIGKEVEVDLSHVSDGIYYLRIKNITLKIIKT